VQEWKDWCGRHLNRYVLATTKEGLCSDGFLEHVDEQNVYLAVPDDRTEADSRSLLGPLTGGAGGTAGAQGGTAFGFPGYGYPPYGYPPYWYPPYGYPPYGYPPYGYPPYGYPPYGYPPYGYPRPRPRPRPPYFPYQRRFQRLALPIGGLSGLTLLPYY